MNHNWSLVALQIRQNIVLTVTWDTKRLEYGKGTTTRSTSVAARLDKTQQVESDLFPQVWPKNKPQTFSHEVFIVQHDLNIDPGWQCSSIVFTKLDINDNGDQASVAPRTLCAVQAEGVAQSLATGHTAWEAKRKTMAKWRNGNVTVSLHVTI